MKRYIVIILGLIIFNSQFSIVNSQNIIRPKIACPNGIWVNSYNGVLFYMRTDVSVPNRGMDLEVVFYYNSSYNNRNYGYGNGWSMGNEMRFLNDSLGIIIEQGDGRQDLFTRNGNSFMSPAGVFSVLTAYNGGYKLREKDGTEYLFTDTVSKQVTQVSNQYGNSLTFAYNGGRLVSISDVNGRSLLLQWSDSLLTQLSTSFDSRIWQYAYDTLGNLATVTDPMGHTVHYAYNAENRISAFTDADGYSTWVTYNDEGRAHRVKTDVSDKSIRYELAYNQTVIVDYLTDGNNQFTTYRWDTLGRVIEKVGNCCGYTSKLAYDADNNVVRMEDANGNATTYTYDANGNMLSLTDPLGYTEQYTYDPTYNKITSFRDKRGGLYQFGYDNLGTLTSITDPMGNVSSFTNNQYGQPLTSTNARGNTSSFSYDQYGNRISETDELGNSYTMQYNVAGLPMSITSPTQGTSHYNYDAAQRLTSATDAMGFATHYTYDARGNVISMVDPRQNSTSVSYDALGHPLTVTGALGNTLHYVYNAKQKVTSRQDAMNGAVRMLYDDHDWLTTVIDEMGDTTVCYYDNIGNVIGITQSSGRLLDYRYDALNRIIYVGDQISIMEQYQYDANGNIVMFFNGIGDTTRMTYNALNQLTQRIDPMGGYDSYTYDNNGNLLTHTDATGSVTSFVYDVADRLIEEHDAMNNVTHYTYDGVGNLTSVQDANGNTTTYQYDANDRLSVITFANGKTRRYWYDGNGNLTRYKDEAGNNIEMTYDALDRLISRSYPDNSQETFTYDLNGNMLSAVNGNATLSFTYDAAGKLLTETQNGQTSQYVYNTRNNTIGIIYPSGRNIVEQYDVRGRLTAINEGGNPVVLMEYNANNRLSQRTYNNGDVTNYTYDPAGRLTSIQSINSIQSIHYTYDAAGNMLSKIDSLNGNRSEQYQYDALHRLIDFKKGLSVSGQIPNPMRHVQYALDALGNRTTVTDNGVATQYTHNNINAYTTVGSQAMQYDNNGNMTSDGSHTYQYNYNNRLIAVDNGNTATYKYDALNRRIQKKVGNGNAITNYYYRGLQMIEEHDENNAVTATYLLGTRADNVLQMKRGSDVYYYHKDLLGTITAMTDNMGNFAESYQYDVYGNTTIFDANGIEVSQSTIGNTYMFTSREMDLETGLYYFRARTLQMNIGRFMQADPYLYVDGYNYYTYVDNRPLFYVDAQGTRNGVVDFFIGGCLDAYDEYKDCGKVSGKNIGKCALDVAGFIPGAGPAAKLGKAGKIANGAKNALKAADKANDMKKAGKAADKMNDIKNANKATDKANDLKNAEKPQKSGGCGGTFDCGSNQVEGPGNPSFENRTNNAREHVGSNKADEERLRYDNVNLHKDSSKKGENIDYGA